jgi:hypothetical protein
MLGLRGSTLRVWLLSHERGLNRRILILQASLTVLGFR